MRVDARDLAWMAVGAAILLVLTVFASRFYEPGAIDAQLAAHNQRVALVGRMRASLASSAEAEKSAVLAITDDESVAFATQARAQEADVEDARAALAASLGEKGSGEERDALSQFSSAFVELRKLDEDILALAVKNTNLKAYALTFGPATDAIDAMTSSLGTLAGRTADDPSSAPATRLASDASVAALRILASLAPHVAEQSDEKMTALENGMAEREQTVVRSLDGLAGIPPVRDAAELAAARSAWSRFEDLKAQIIRLSRENTNVRSLDMSLNRKRAVFVACQNALDALGVAVENEPVGTKNAGRWALPR